MHPGQSTVSLSLTMVIIDHRFDNGTCGAPTNNRDVAPPMCPRDTYVLCGRCGSGYVPRMT